jgi:AcrR family transcriptional regulator
VIIDVNYDESKTKYIQRNTILNQAFRLFIDKGIQNVTMQDIAEASSIQRRTLYYYYNNKEALAVELINCFMGESKKLLLHIPNYLDTGYARLEYIFHTFLDYMLNNEDVVLFTVQTDYYFQKNYGETNGIKGMMFTDDFIEPTFLSELRHGIEDGSIKKQYAHKMDEVFFVLLSSIFSLAQRLLFREDIIKMESGYDRKSISVLIDVLLSGLKA